jgi:hypothetical protein
MDENYRKMAVSVVKSIKDQGEQQKKEKTGLLDTTCLNLLF